ncbi:Hypothetical_protein [Hexamita inflata]|uniref:Hypothetical_protein n=1 Tax=Hexamita inflata TaxID=28002 RepID=A0AA86T9T2_9EUKA|nr:Hypothetical protein HINF_LOCUS809 [Hexamita inflata]
MATGSISERSSLRLFRSDFVQILRNVPEFFKCGDRCSYTFPDSARQCALLSGVLAQDPKIRQLQRILCFNAAPPKPARALRQNGRNSAAGSNYQEDSWPETSDRSLYNMRLLAQEHGSESQSRRAQQSLAQWPAQLAKESQSRRRLGFQLSISKTSDQDRTIMVSGLLARLCVAVYLSSPLRVALAKSGRPTVIFKLGAPVKIQFAHFDLPDESFCLAVLAGRKMPSAYRPVRALRWHAIFCVGRLRQTGKDRTFRLPAVNERNAARNVICWCPAAATFFVGAALLCDGRQGNGPPFTVSYSLNCGRAANQRRRRRCGAYVSSAPSTAMLSAEHLGRVGK